MNPVFISTPAIAFGSCYDVLLAMYDMARTNIDRAFDILVKYDEHVAAQIEEDEDYIDTMADRVSNYLLQISSKITAAEHVEIMNQYYSGVTEFERLGDHAMNIKEVAESLKKSGETFSDPARAELKVLRRLINTVLDYTHEAFKKRDLLSARHIEPLEEVVDDMIGVLSDNHLKRLREGRCGVYAGTDFLDLLSEIERISDICSNVGVATVARVKPEMKHQVHEYVSMLHSGRDESFNREYQEAHDYYLDY